MNFTYSNAASASSYFEAVRFTDKPKVRGIGTFNHGTLSLSTTGELQVYPNASIAANSTYYAQMIWIAG